VPSFRFRFHGSRFQVSGSRFQVLGVTGYWIKSSLERGTWNLELGTWNLEPEPWNLKLETLTKRAANDGGSHPGNT
jgi:hypothetical protein